MFLHDPENDWGGTEKDDFNLYFQEYDNLAYDNEYSVTVRATNRVNKTHPIQGESSWITFKTPNCWDLTKSTDVCGPMKITGMFSEIKAVAGNVYAINVTWDQPLVRPEYYELVIYDFDPKRDPSGDEGVYKYQLNKVSQSFVYLMLGVLRW